MKGWRAANPGRHREHSVKSLYGLSAEAYHALLTAQKSVCAICQRPPMGRGELHVDHDHTTGVVRGLLCQKCNQGLGQLDDSPERLRQALAYLARSS